MKLKARKGFWVIQCRLNQCQSGFVFFFSLYLWLVIQSCHSLCYQIVVLSPIHTHTFSTWTERVCVCLCVTIVLSFVKRLVHALALTSGGINSHRCVHIFVHTWFAFESTTLWYLTHISKTSWKQILKSSWNGYWRVTNCRVMTYFLVEPERCNHEIGGALLSSAELR